MPAVVRFEIFPADLDVTTRFYTEVLGFQIRRDNRGSAAPYVAMERNGIKLGAAARPSISSQESRRPPIGVELVLEVDDLRAERDRVATTGWPVTEELADRPWGLRDFRLVDPDGYYWRITSRDT